MSDIVYVNGDYVPADQAKVSIFDRGFLFGDGIYEVIPVVNSHLVDKQYFLERLESSLGKMQLQWPCTPQQYIEVQEQLIARNNLSEGSIYSQVTRGVAERDFPYPANTPTSFIAFTSSRKLLDHDYAETGVKVVSTDDLRWKRRDIKSLNLLGQCMAKQDVASKGAYEGWMVEEGFVTEGVTSSAYIVIDGKIITRALSNLILPGIRRRTLFDIAAAQGIEIEQRLFTIAEAQAADEAFLSSATTVVLGIISIDGTSIGTGKPGPVTQLLRNKYMELMAKEAEV